MNNIFASGALARLTFRAVFTPLETTIQSSANSTRDDVAAGLFVLLVLGLVVLYDQWYRRRKR